MANFMSEFKDMEHLFGKTSFTPDECFKLFASMSKLYEFQGKLLSQLLKMVASLVSNFNQEQLMKNGATSAKQTNKENIPITEEPQPPPKSDVIREEPMYIMPIESQSNFEVQSNDVAPILVTDDDDQILRLERHQYTRREHTHDPFKKKFKKLASNGPECIKKPKLDQQNQQPDISRLFKQNIRNKDQRKQLTGHFCEECMRFTDGMNLTEREKQMWCKDCSKHRGNNNIIYQELNLFPSPME